MLGVPPLFGRLLTVADEDPSAPQAIVLSYGTWRDLFGEDRGAIGKTITMDGVPRAVVGVMPASFSFLGGPSAFYVPARFDAAFRENRDQYFIQAVGRLRRESSIQQARSEMETVAARLRRDWPVFNTNLKIVVQPMQETIVGGSRSQLMVLMGAVAFVLLITCANLGNLLLARTSGRRREIAVRQALGAGQGRVTRQLLTESVVLALIGGVLGLIVGKLFLALLLAAQATTNLPRSDEIALDGRVLAFNFAISAAAGPIFGLVPAWQLGRGPSSEALREGTRGSSSQQWTRSALVVAELALAMVLLTGAGLFVGSLRQVQGQHFGFDVDRLIVTAVDLRPLGYQRAEVNALYQQMRERVQALPGVTGARIVCVANLRPLKDHVTLLRAMALVLQRQPHLRPLRVRVA